MRARRASSEIISPMVFLSRCARSLAACSTSSAISSVVLIHQMLKASSIRCPAHRSGLALCRVVDRSPAGTSARSLPRETSGLIRTTLIRHQYLHTEQGHEKHHQFRHEAFGQRSRRDGTHSGFRVDFPLFHANVPSVLDLASGLSSGGGRGGKRKGPENFTDQRTAKQGMRITP